MILRKGRQGIFLNDIGRKWSPFTIGNKFYIKPGSYADKKDLINISLGDGRAFGSGEHETTRHCLEFIATLSFFPHQKILDYGTGTGILSIAAAKLSAGFVLALDIDFDALLACQKNIQINYVNRKIFPACGDVTGINPLFQFHYIFANIYADIIIERSALLNNLLQQDGYMLLSGIDWDYVDDVKRCFLQLNYQIVNQKTGKDYNSILYRKVFG